MGVVGKVSKIYLFFQWQGGEGVVGRVRMLNTENMTKNMKDLQLPLRGDILLLG